MGNKISCVGVGGVSQSTTRASQPPPPRTTQRTQVPNHEIPSAAEGPRQFSYWPRDGRRETPPARADTGVEDQRPSVRVIENANLRRPEMTPIRRQSFVSVREMVAMLENNLASSSTENNDASVNPLEFPRGKVPINSVSPNVKENAIQRTLGEPTQKTTAMRNNDQGYEATTITKPRPLTESTKRDVSVNASVTGSRSSGGGKKIYEEYKSKLLSFLKKSSQGGSETSMGTRRTSGTTVVNLTAPNSSTRRTSMEPMDTEKAIAYVKSLNRDVEPLHRESLNRMESSDSDVVQIASCKEYQEDSVGRRVNLPSSIHSDLESGGRLPASQHPIDSDRKEDKRNASTLSGRDYMNMHIEQPSQEMVGMATNVSSRRVDSQSRRGSSSPVDIKPPSASYYTSFSKDAVKLISDVNDSELLLLICDHFSQYHGDTRSFAIVGACNSMLKRMEEKKQKNGTDGSESPCGSKWEESSLFGSESDDSDSEDEFDEYSTKNYPLVPDESREGYSFAVPTIEGKISPVFSTGMLYKILTDNGECHLFNDTMHHVMVVRVVTCLTGNEAINEKALVSTADGEESEITLAVLPEETMFLMDGVTVSPLVVAKGVPPPANYISPSIKECMEKVDAAVGAVRKAMGKWSRASDQKSFLKCCVKNNLLFTDLEFRPSASSLFRPGVDECTIPPLPWRRPTEYLPITEVGQIRLFRRHISCHFVKRGSLNDHSVVAGISAVAMFPDHLHWMFRHPLTAEIGKLERSVGAYRVTLCVGGWWTTLLLDDYFPASLNEALFARCPVDPRRLWVSLLEKAYAKVRGSYSALCDANALEVLTDFTGYPCRVVDELWSEAKKCPEVSNSLYTYINESVKQKFIVGVYKRSSKAVTARSMDLPPRMSKLLSEYPDSVPLFEPDHVYFITDALYYEGLNLRMVRVKNPWIWQASENNSKQDEGKRLRRSVQLERNPFSASGANLLQSRLSSMYSIHAPAACNDIKFCDNDHPGTLWLEWSEALSLFDGAAVCYTLQDWSDYRVKNCFRQGIPDVVLKITVNNRTEAILTIRQDGASQNSEEESNIKNEGIKGANYDAVLLSVSHYSTASNMQTLVWNSSTDLEERSGSLAFNAVRDVSLKCVFEPESSPYYVFPLVHPQCIRKESPFVISLLCEGDISDSDTGVNFCHINQSCEVFKNMKTFSIRLGMCAPITASYQHRTTRGVSSHTGNCIEN